MIVDKEAAQAVPLHVPASFRLEIYLGQKINVELCARVRIT